MLHLVSHLQNPLQVAARTPTYSTHCCGLTTVAQIDVNDCMGYSNNLIIPQTEPIILVFKMMLLV